VEQMTEQFNSEIPVLRNEDIVANYTNRLQAAVDYDGSVNEARDLYQQSITVTPPSQDDSGIGTLQMQSGDVPVMDGSDNDRFLADSPDVNLDNTETKASVLARLFNAAPESVQKIVTPALVPFTNNKVLRGITIGMGDGINGSLNLLRDVNNAMHPDNQFTEEQWLQIPEIIERGDSTTEAIVGGLAQFMSVYGALGKLSSVNKLSGGAAKLWDDMWRAGLADAAFDPEDGNLATFINMLDEDETFLGLPIGKLNGPFTQWLGTPVGEDADAWERLEGRLRGLLEGAGLGLFVHGAVAGFKGMKGWMIEQGPDRYIAMLKKAGFDVDPRQFLFENTLGAENIVTPQVNELGMYSQLEKAMLNMTQDKNKPDDLLRYLRKNGVTNDELNNSGVMDLINDKKAAGESLTKDEVMEVFTDMDVTQSYQATTRTYERPSDIDSMTDEDELLEIYLAGGDTSLSRYDNVNGKVLDPDEVDADIEFAREEIMRKFDEDIYDGDDAVTLLNNMRELYPEKYPHPEQTDAADAFYEQLKTINDDTEFRQHAEEATRLMAEKQYDANPIFKWDLTEGNYNYVITGNEDGGYTTKIFNAADGANIDELDVVYSANEAMVQVQGHQANFGSGAVRTGDDTRHSNLIVHTDAIDTYKETVITADSPSGTIFKGGKAHFPEDNKVFHLRTTEIVDDTARPSTSEGNAYNTLYIEELQSDWANDISKKGVQPKGSPENIQTKLKQEIKIRNKALEDTAFVMKEISNDSSRAAYIIAGPENLVLKPYYLQRGMGTQETWNNLGKAEQDRIIQILMPSHKLEKELLKFKHGMPQSPLPNDRWINVGLRTAIAQAIDSGKTRVEWTPAQVHVDRWSGQYEKMYKILYDEKMGGIAKKIANKYNANAGQHYIDISPEMIAHHKSGKGDKAMAAAPAIPAAQVANDKEDKS
jgi:hypothetical protein